METDQNKMPPFVHLQYDKDELIVKEGDYGISIYKLLKGNVKVFKDSGDTQITLATLGPGEIFGEMTFLTHLLEARSASVKALDDVEVEVWHPAKLTKEYHEMPPILKYIIDQSLNRLIRMNKVIGQLAKKTEKEKEPPKKQETERRKLYRKEFDKTCHYRPVGSSTKKQLEGRITDISVGGIAMDVRANNAIHFSHEPGDKFELHTTLPNGQDLKLAGKIKSAKKGSKGGLLHLGLEYSEFTGDNAKRLRFFMMP